MLLQIYVSQAGKYSLLFQTLFSVNPISLTPISTTSADDALLLVMAPIRDQISSRLLESFAFLLSSLFWINASIYSAINVLTQFYLEIFIEMMLRGEKENKKITSR